MNIHRLQEPAGPGLAEALDRFERQFVYPLGPGRSFRISHGRDYSRFFRAIGGEDGATFVAESDDGEVLGTLGIALRPLQHPDGSCGRAAYVGDLKTVPDLRRARALVGLAARAFAWGRGGGAQAVYGIVMDGTPRTPATYTGRFGLPAFQPLGALLVLRIPLEGFQPDHRDGVAEVEPAAIGDSFARLGRSARAFATLGGQPLLRSMRPAIGLATANGRACGVLEDTRAAKRLVENGGDEMRSAHLGSFGWRATEDACELVRGVLRRLADDPAARSLFVSVPRAAGEVVAALRREHPGMVEASATIYGAGLPAGARWHVSSSEI